METADWNFIICYVAVLIVAAVLTWALKPFDDLKEILKHNKGEN